ncbi:Rft protein-domain-containing protein [Panaeolus papilionaceus]|nr:Rft protein-domain-containing protein [Panaeolus papilionaceus]
MSSLLQTSILTASSLMALQLFSRLFTFGLNQALFRLASPAAYGAAAIQFELVLSSILFLSREGVRNAVLRAPKHTADGKPGNNEEQQVKQDNLSFLPTIIGIPLALLTSIAYARFAAEEVRKQPYFSTTITIYALAAVGELLSEPMYNLAMSTLQTSVRVRTEGLAISAKSVSTLLVLLCDARRHRAHPDIPSGELGLISFAVGQLAYSVVLLGGYIANFGFAAISPRRPGATRASKKSPLEDQGGSLIARIVFQPIEETLRLFFSRTLSEIPDSPMVKGRETPKLTAPHQAILTASRTLSTLLTIQSAFSLLLVVFGSSYIGLILPLLLPRSFLHTSAPRVLSAWVWYIPFLALNGGLEAFFTSVATTSDFMNQSRWMVLFSTLYIGSAIVLYRAGFGDASLVYANIINLSARIAYCINFAQSFFNGAVKSPTPDASESDLVFSARRAIFPSWGLVLSVSIARAIISKSENYFRPLECLVADNWKAYEFCHSYSEIERQGRIMSDTIPLSKNLATVFTVVY